MVRIRGALAWAFLFVGLATACTSPGSVRSLSTAQGQRLEEFAESLDAAIVVARADRHEHVRFKLKLQENQLKALNRNADANAAKIAAANQHIAKLKAQLAGVDTAYSSLSEYVRKILIPSNVALDAWHHRSGISLIDNDSIASWAQSIAQTGVTSESITELADNFKKETGGELKALKSELRTSAQAALETNRLVTELGTSVGVNHEEIASMKAVLNRLKEQITSLKETE